MSEYIIEHRSDGVYTFLPNCYIKKGDCWLSCQKDNAFILRDSIEAEEIYYASFNVNPGTLSIKSWFKNSKSESSTNTTVGYYDITTQRIITLQVTASNLDFEPYYDILHWEVISMSNLGMKYTISSSKGRNINVELLSEGDITIRVRLLGESDDRYRYDTITLTSKRGMVVSSDIAPPTISKESIIDGAIYTVTNNHPNGSLYYSTDGIVWNAFTDSDHNQKTIITPITSFMARVVGASVSNYQGVTNSDITYYYGDVTKLSAPTLWYDDSTFKFNGRAGATVYYTVDNTIPTIGGTTTRSITTETLINASEVYGDLAGTIYIKAFMVYSGCINSDISETPYTSYIDVVFRDYEDTEDLWVSKTPYNHIPGYNGKTPTKDTSASHTFSWDGWSSSKYGNLTNLERVNKNSRKKYYAHFASTIRSFKITFINNGSTISSKYIAYGQSAEEPSKPSKSSDISTYTFSYWMESNTGSTYKYGKVPTVTTNATYSAVYSSTPIYHNKSYSTSGSYWGQPGSTSNTQWFKVVKSGTLHVEYSCNLTDGRFELYRNSSTIGGRYDGYSDRGYSWSGAYYVSDGDWIGYKLGTEWIGSWASYSWSLSIKAWIT